MVNPTVNEVAGSFNELARDRDIVGYGALAGILAGGAFLAQRITREVLPFFGLSPSGSSTSSLVAQFMSKIAVAFVLAYAAMQVADTNSAPYALLGAAAAGAVTMAGSSLFRIGESVVFDQQLPGGNTVSQTASSVSRAGSPSPSSSGSATASAQPF